MRLPVSKIYRAFASLDPFTDEQCEGYVRRAKRKHWFSMVVVGMLAVPVALLVALAGSVGLYTIGSKLNQAGLLGDSDQTLIFVVLAMVAVALAAFMSGVLMRDAWLRWAIGVELRRSTCPGCEYQLLGLQAAAGKVRCPECGMESRTDLLRLTEADLHMVRAPEHPPLAP